MKRERIILIPNLAAWIVGEISRHIIRTLDGRFDFFFIPESLFHRRPDLIRALLPGTSLIHAMNESAVSLLVGKFGGENLPPVIAWIHHVTNWSSDHDVAARHSQAIIACTPGWASQIEKLNPHPVPVHTIRHGVDSNFFRHAPGARARYGIPQDAFVAGFVAHRGSDSDNNRKGFPVLLDVIQTVARRVPNLHLLMLGPGWEQSVGELQASGIRAQYISFLPRSEVPGLFSALDAYLLTSRVEGGPCTVLESMACGTPVVATRVGLVPDVVQDGINSYSAPVGDVRSLAEALTALATDRDRAQEIGSLARATAKEHNWNRNLSPLGDIYETYLRPAPASSSEPSWIRHPEQLLGPAHAADVIGHAWDDWRKSSGKTRTILRTMKYGLEGVSTPDVLRGAGLLKGLDFH